MDFLDFLHDSAGGFLGSALATALIGAIVSALFLRRNRRIESEITAYFDERLRVFESTRLWKQQALAQLFGPAHMQLERTRRAFHRWKARNLYLEAKVVREGNQTIRDLLLNQGHLIPPALMDAAGLLVEHYDAWLEEFDRVRGDSEQASDTEFVFAGARGFPFPVAAEQQFQNEFRRLQQELYGV
ncbi:hypothetical protein IB229_04165 [Pseudomonas sp. PDM14]|uniref:hypothetical protein n=1 Tax=Pseudomonas sp. PDM14 TaxID=2769288 RepID=UPI0017804AEE|nr:hypothetical protein [Pseudomonas sp. PDM14]MBD9482151.1 hypothetical protein [Pseudomonas sp. PDM14]